MTTLRGSRRRAARRKAVDTIGAPGSDRRERLHFAWFTAVMLYAALRIVLITLFLEKYGVNPWIFGVIEVSSSIPYAIGSARFVTALVDGDNHGARVSAMVGLLGFVAPDAYILLSGTHVPGYVYVVIGTVIVISVFTAFFSIRSKVRSARTGG